MPRLELPADPLCLAARLLGAGLEGVALLHSAEACRPGMFSYVSALPDRRCHALDPIEELPLAGPAEGRDVPCFIGVLPYEARRSLERDGWRPPEGRPAPWIAAPIWQRYPAMIAVDHDRREVTLTGDEPHKSELARALRCAPPAGDEIAVRAVEDEPPEAHVARVTRARELILAGDLYQVSLARQLGLVLERGTPFEIYRRMVARAPAELAAYLELGGDLRVLSTSPELLLDARACSGERWPRFGELTTAPIKGTRPRGQDEATDEALARELDTDPKEIAELAMIIDVVRSDLARVSDPGTVRLLEPPRVRRHATVHHRAAVLVARARAEATRREVIEALVPSGSVTGAPKVRAMEIIAELESHRRGLYTGGLGYVSRGGSLHLAMAIRTLVMSGREGRYFSGGGIVADSDPERELAETRWKALQLMLGGGGSFSRGAPR